MEKSIVDILRKHDREMEKLRIENEKKKKEILEAFKIGVNRYEHE